MVVSTSQSKRLFAQLEIEHILCSMEKYRRLPFAYNNLLSGVDHLLDSAKLATAFNF